jgi:hypothetical protein
VPLFVADGALPLNPDSWALYELSKTVFTEFYASNHLRNFADTRFQSAAFPPLWPVLLAAINSFSDSGPKAGLYAGLVFFLPFAFFSERIGRLLFAAPWIGLSAAILSFAHYGYWDELVAGRTMPLQLALYAVIIWLAALPSLGLGRAWLIGLFAGLSVLNRFDALPLVLTLPLVLFLTGASIRGGFAYLFGALTGLFPWIYYSLSRFGAVFASESGGVALLSDKSAYVTDWWPSPQATVFEDPAGWIEKVSINLAKIPIYIAASPRFALLAYGAVFATAVTLTFRQRRKRSSTPTWLLIRSTAARGRRPLILAAAFLALLPGYVLTGYFDARYFAPLWWIGSMVVLGFLTASVAGERRQEIGLLCAGVALAGALALTAGRTWGSINELIFVDRVEHRYTRFPVKPMDEQLLRCFPGDPRGQATMFYDAIEASRFAAVHRSRTLLVPLNLERLSPEEVRQFLRTFDVRYVLFRSPHDKNYLHARVSLAPVPGCPAEFFRIVDRPISNASPTQTSLGS